MFQTLNTSLACQPWPTSHLNKRLGWTVWLSVPWYSWFRKKHPRALEYVAPPPLPDSEDGLRCMTVLPYLEDLHRGATPSEEEEYELELEPGELPENKDGMCILCVQTECSWNMYASFTVSGLSHPVAFVICSSTVGGETLSSNSWTWFLYLVLQLFANCSVLDRKVCIPVWQLCLLQGEGVRVKWLYRLRLCQTQLPHRWRRNRGSVLGASVWMHANSPDISQKCRLLAVRPRVCYGALTVTTLSSASLGSLVVSTAGFRTDWEEEEHLTQAINSHRCYCLVLSLCGVTLFWGFAVSAEHSIVPVLEFVLLKRRHLLSGYCGHLPI